VGTSGVMNDRKKRAILISKATFVLLVCASFDFDSSVSLRPSLGGARYSLLAYHLDLLGVKEIASCLETS